MALQSNLVEFSSLVSSIPLITSPSVVMSGFGEMPVVARTPQFSLASVFPISVLRDTVAVTGSGTVAKTTGGSEYMLATTAAANDSAALHSSERGAYKPGYSVNIGIGVRMPVIPTGSQKAIWGYFDTNNGFYFGADATSNYVAYLNAGVETIIRQSSWNIDKLDGTGSSGLTLDPTNGNIFQITFSWYGYGVIEYNVVLPATKGLSQIVVTVHRFSPKQSTSIAVPNLPVGATITNGSTAKSFWLYVAGRQFSIVGVNQPSERTTCATVLSKSISATRIPILTFQRNGATDSLYIPVRLSGFDAIVSTNAVLEVILNGTLTGASYTAIPGINSPETALQIDQTATAISGGNIVFASLLGTSGTTKTAQGSASTQGLALDVPDGQPLSICVTAITGTGTASLTGRMIEDW